MRRVLNFLKYFFYVAINHNPVLAFRIITDEIRGERKYHLNTTDVLVIKNQKLINTNTAHSNEYMPANYVLMERAFSVINEYEHNKTFLDIGCGKGRALFVAAATGFTNITGVEFYAPYCHTIHEQIAMHEKEYPLVSFSVNCMDAVTYTIPDHIHTIFFYNPFDEIIMEKVLARIIKSLGRVYRPMFIIYLSPVYKQQFINAGFKEIYHTSRFGRLEAIVLIWTEEAGKKMKKVA